MRHLSKLFVVGALISATVGVGPAGAARPDPPPEPIVTIDGVAVTCAEESLVVSVSTVSTDVGSLTDVGINAARIGRVRADLVPYQPAHQQESWGAGWWEGSGDSIPDLPLTLDTADEWGVSWTNHSVMGPADGFNATPYWEVGVWAGAVNTSGKGKRGGNSSWGWADRNWTVDCETGTAVLTENPDFEWCWEDEWTHEQGFTGPVRWNETEDAYELC